MSSTVEFSCGCIVHPTHGRIRYCRAKSNITLSGRVTPISAEDEFRHKKAKVVRLWSIA